MPTYFPENNAPTQGDSDNRLLHKIAGALDGSLSTAPNVSMGFGPSVADTLRVTLASDGTLVDILGDVGNNPAPSDTGPANFNMLLKRGLQNWTALLSRVPVLGAALASASSPVAAPQKLTVYGFAPVATATPYTNLLDSAAGSAALDVSNYQSGDLVVVSTATTGSYTVQAALNAAFTLGVHTLQMQEKTSQNTNPVNAAQTPTNATRVFQLNLQGANFIRVNLTTGITGGTIRAFAVLNQSSHIPFQFNVQQATAANMAVTASIATSQTLGAVTNAGTPAAPATPYFVNSAASTNGALILTGTSGLQAFHATNTGASAAFVKLFNKATAPVVGTDVPEMVIPVPAAVGGVPGVNPRLDMGFNSFRFPLGLGIAITGGAADSDTTAVAAGQVKVKLSRTV
jgi:hypothetical protein